MDIAESSGTGQELLAARDICRRYGRRWALAGVDFSVSAGTAVALLGRNGSGKSTLLRVLATAIRPDRGSILLDGHDARLDLAWSRRRIAYAGHASYLYDELSAIGNLDIVSSLHKRSGMDLSALLREVGLNPERRDPVSTYSAGMKKRLSLARLLLIAPSASVVLMDEPHSSLDREGHALVETIVRRFVGEGKAVVIATHLFDRAAALCQRAVVLEEGRLAWSGSPSDLPSWSAGGAE